MSQPESPSACCWGCSSEYCWPAWVWVLVTHVLLPLPSFAPARGAAPASGAGTNTVEVTSEGQAPAAPGGWAGLRERLATRDKDLSAARGTFGDMFGALNALFSALAFACVFYTLLLQRRDLELQRVELQQSRALAITAAKLQGRSTLAAVNLETYSLAKDADARERLRQQVAGNVQAIEELLEELKNMEEQGRKGAVTQTQGR